MAKHVAVELSEQDMAILAYRNAQKEYYAALERLNWADDDMFDIANEEVTAAFAKFNVEAKKVKMLCGKIPDTKDVSTGKKFMSKITS